jgi:hypothetical protein
VLGDALVIMFLVEVLCLFMIYCTILSLMKLGPLICAYNGYYLEYPCCHLNKKFKSFTTQLSTDGNTLGIGKEIKIPSPPPTTPYSKEKTLHPSHWQHEISLFVTIFNWD